MKKIITVASIRKGAKGISEERDSFEFFFVQYEYTSAQILYKAPIQKPRITVEIPHTSPNNAPIPKTNFASPKPIHLPLETSHRNANGKKRINGEALSSMSEKDTGNPVRKRKKSNLPTVRIINVYTSVSGIIICLRSYRVMMVRILKMTI